MSGPKKLPATGRGRGAAALHSVTLGPSPAERARARTVTLTETDAATIASIMHALPDPAGLPPNALVLVPGSVIRARSLAGSVLTALGRRKTVARSLRCSALVARGYVDVGAAGDEDPDADLAWGYAPDGEITVTAT